MRVPQDNLVLGTVLTYSKGSRNVSKEGSGMADPTMNEVNSAPGVLETTFCPWVILWVQG